MTENTLNIFDLMQGSSNKAEAGQFGMLGSIGQKDVLNTDQQEVSFDMIFGSMLASLSPEQSGQNETLLQEIPAQENLVQENQTIPQLSTLDSQVGNTEQIKVDENVLAFNKELDELISQNMPLQNVNIKDILAQQDTKLENGQFEVISKEVVDSKVALTIENPNGKQLTISLPIESLQNLKSNGTSQRVTLEDSYYKKELETLLQKVDVKQIEIKSPETNAVQSAFKPVEISIIGEQNSAVVTLKASLKKNQIKIKELKSQPVNQKAAVLDESGVFDEKIIVNNNQSDKLIEKASFDTKGQVAKSKQNISQQIGSQVKSDVLNQPVERTDSVMYSYNTDKIDRAAVKENMQNVRMQLPENINSALRPNGQAVVIKMNPENLGPAKLSLSFSGGKLRAKLSVTSLNAKHVLDHSLNRLVDQLHKIDINVDKFDVTLDQNQNKNEQFNQQQQWQRKMSYKNIDLEQFNQNELEQTVQQPILSAAQQVLSGSVNYLA